MPFLHCIAFLSILGGQSTVAPKEFRETLTLPADGRVELQSERGTMHIRTWDRQEVQVFARIEPDPNSLSPEEDLRRAEVKIEAIPHGIRMLTDLGSPSDLWHSRKSNRLPHVFYEIRVPSQVNLTLNDSRSVIDTNDLSGQLSLQTDRSSVRVGGFTGALYVRATRGDISVNVFTVTESSRFETNRTALDVGLANRRGLNLDINLNRVAPFTDEVHGSDVVTLTRHARVNVREPAKTEGPTVTFTADRGAVRLRRV